MARKVVAERKLQGGLDLTTAHAITTLADALTAENAAKLNALPLERAAAITWKLVK